MIATFIYILTGHLSIAPQHQIHYYIAPCLTQVYVGECLVTVWRVIYNLWVKIYEE